MGQQLWIVCVVLRLYLILICNFDNSGGGANAFVVARRTGLSRQSWSCQWAETEASITTDVASDASESESTSDKKPSDLPPSFYRDSKGRWRERQELQDLHRGQALSGRIVQEFLTGKTGPKVFLEVGVGRRSGKKRRGWKIVHAMLRLPPSKKLSVSQKRAARLRKKARMQVYVHRILPEKGMLEVVLSRKEVTDNPPIPQRSALSLDTGEELPGTVERVLDYGVLIRPDGVHRHGLLHIRRVADLYGRYVAPNELKECGLGVGSRLRVAVRRRQGYRVHFDFTREVREQAQAAREAEQAADEARYKRNEERLKEQQAAAATTTESENPETSSSSTLSAEEQAAWAAFAVNDGSTTTVEEEPASEPNTLSAEEQAAWAAFAANDGAVTTTAAAAEEEDDDDDDEYEDDDDYDEDRDIEDALGLGSY